MRLGKLWKRSIIFENKATRSQIFFDMALGPRSLRSSGLRAMVKARSAV
jgi:hypothetical protein